MLASVIFEQDVITWYVITFLTNIPNSILKLLQSKFVVIVYENSGSWSF